ncbi:hypothetical protein SZ51_11410, partial [Brachyspira hyodysenteriae]
LTVRPPCGGNNVCLKNIYPKVIYEYVVNKLGINKEINYTELFPKKLDNNKYYLGSVINNIH